MEIFEFIESIVNWFNQNYKDKLLKSVQTILDQKGWNILAFIILAIFAFIFVGWSSILLTFLAISQGIE